MNNKISNLSYLNNVTDGNKELLLEIMGLFLEQIDEFTIETKESLTAKDWLRLAAIMHKAKSSIKSFGAMQTAEIIEEIEFLSKGNVHEILKQKKNTGVELNSTELMNLSKVKIFTKYDLQLDKIPQLIETFNTHCDILKQEISEYKKELAL